MKVKNITYSLKNKKAVLSAQIVLLSGKKHDIYFAVDEEFKDFIAKDASAFLAAVLAIAMKKNEDLEIDGALSEHLMANTPEIMKIITSWNLGLQSVSINARSLKKDLKTTKNSGCFFSGGVDSFYTYLKNGKKIRFLLFVHGFDININDKDLYTKIEKNIIKIAKNRNAKLIRVQTNVRETFEQYFDWDFSHAFAIASVALFLRQGLKEMYVSCGLPNKNTDHHYMTPELDSLWSTEGMSIMHYGCDADKISKLSFLSHFPLVMENLRVCWLNKKRQYNCCECEKCFRNMLALYVSGSLEKCKTFNKKLDLEKLKNTRVSEYVLKYFIALLENLKSKNDTSDVRFALEAFIRNNTFPAFQQRLYWDVRDFVRQLDKEYNRNRLFWFLSNKGFIK